MLAYLLIASLFTARVAAWGREGHYVVGYIAQALLRPNASSFVSDYLNPGYKGSLANAASWPDEVRLLPEYEWSKKWHFLEVEDSPTSGSCNVEPSHCQSGGCIHTAIRNYTYRVQDATLDERQRDEALKFLTHFFGDITQPLHNENLDVGGNKISVTFAGQKGPTFNLHKVWDDHFIQLHLKQHYKNDVQTYAKSLLSRIEFGDLAPAVQSWSACIPKSSAALRPDAFVLQSRGPEKGPLWDCPLSWSRESNALDCSFVYTYPEGKDLLFESDYYEKALPIIDVQLAKGGYRLAAWLNAIFEAAAF